MAGLHPGSVPNEEEPRWGFIPLEGRQTEKGAGGGEEKSLVPAGESLQESSCPLGNLCLLTPLSPFPPSHSVHDL